ncbi:hypothetical protein PFICI_09719 [Pestalotiopsis fici W106-1]|uniref:Peptidase A1 domain-containing protein n=1 Tax=Pestalotiopsis fici (strain W106-1 / CGMCC3.15140) TaxID=1229662 RepID=W3WX05_PESFW|nr:uncharacterized protein PFICI_09719 [Pestalotiopsis fici W106-1]ETS77657.1 hypothetical protein PFICI_09719 [Pestalotiopsis fici W106-1]
MRTSSALAATAAVCAAGLTTAQRVVPVGIKRSEHRLPVPPTLNKRNTYTQSLNNNITGAGYYAAVAVGTPPQNLSLVLDTGSSDIWLLSTDADLCEDTYDQRIYGYCLPTYEPDDSSTYKLVDRNGFDISYVDGTGAQGDYIKDDFYVGGASINQLQMGLATESTIPVGIMGVGFAANEAVYEEDRYPNIMDVFISQDLIGSRAYSLYLNDYGSSTGSILFGGIDTEKFIGELTSIDLVTEQGYDEIYSFTVPLNALSMSINGAQNDSIALSDPVPVILDSGTTLTYVPSTVVSDIYSAVGAKYASNYGISYIDCKYMTSDLEFGFQFGGSDGPTIVVPADEVVFDTVDTLEEAGYDTPRGLGFDSDDACLFGILPNDEYYLLGDTFLRSAYVLYDLDNYRIAIAQANLNSTTSNVIEITNSSTSLPDVTGVASQVQVTQTATGLPGVGGGGLPTVTVTGTASASTSGSAGARAVPAPDWMAAVIAAVTGLGVLAGGMIFAL